MRTILIPENYVCPITHEIMHEPVSTMDGHTYEKAAIIKWLSNYTTSPLTNKVLTDKQTIPNLFAKQAITHFLEENNLISYDNFIDAVTHSSIDVLLNVNIADTYLERLNDDGLAPIHIAAKNGCLEIITLLINAGANIEMPDSGGDHKGNTPLIWAACSDHTKVMEFLLHCGAKVDNYDKAKWTALHWAVNCNRINAASLLLRQQADVNAQTQDGNTCLHIIAPENANTAWISLLLDHGASFKIVNNANKTALQTLQKNDSTVAKFIQNYKENIKFKKQVNFANILSINEQQSDTIKQLHNKNKLLEQRISVLEEKVLSLMKNNNPQMENQAQVINSSASLSFFNNVSST